MTGPGDRYDTIGRSYAKTRQEDSRVAAAIHAALGAGVSVLNIGAGSGNYEPWDRDVVTVEPSLQMLQQRHGRQARTIRGVAEHLPFPNKSFDVAMAVLTVHHWSDRAAGISEMARVSRRQVVFFFEPLKTHNFWALEYFPAALDLPTERDPPGEQFLADHLEVREIRTVLVPHDCQDGFGTAFWARPEAYLDPEVQAGMSWLAMLSEADRQRGARRLQADLDAGEWDRRYGQLRQQAAYDGGYRIAVAY